MPKRSSKKPTKGLDEEAHRIIANYMKASAALATYLQENGVLTSLQEQSVHATLETTRILFYGGRRQTRGSVSIRLALKPADFRIGDYVINLEAQNTKLQKEIVAFRKKLNAKAGK